MRTPGKSLVLATLLAAVLPAGPAQAAPRDQLTWHETVLDADQSFRGLDAVDRRTAWVSGGSVSGGDGSVWRTTDGGASWQEVSPPGTTGLSLRDVEAFDADSALVLSVGNGPDSRIWRTDDGGQTWTETFRNTEETAFYNCLDFYAGGRRGLAVSDPVDGKKFRVISTRDGGRSWRVLPDAGMPDSTGDFNFSASGDCLTVSGRDAWFGAGGTAGQPARIYHSRDHGLTWTATESGLPAGESAGVFALAFHGPRHGVAVGGDFDPAAETPDGTGRTRDGRQWRAGGDLAHLGEDVSWASGRLVVTTGQSDPERGTSTSTDGGRSWTRVSKDGYHTLDCVPGRGCWAAGGGGRVALARP